MRSFHHWLIIAWLAFLMSRVGFYLLDSFDAKANLSDWHSIKWFAWSSAVSIATWTFIWSIARRRESLLLWAFLGLLSPVIGSVLFFPLTMGVWMVIMMHPVIVFTVGLTTGLMAGMITIFGRKRGWFEKTNS